MLETSNPNIDIDHLLKRIRDEVARQKGRIKLPDGSKRPPMLSVGSVLRFGESGDASDFIGTGWGTAEISSRWTEGRESELQFELPAVEGDLLLTFKVDPLIGGKTEAQQVQAEWNGVLVGEWTVRSAGTYSTFVWSRHLQLSRLVTLRFVCFNAFSPASVGLNADPRLLALNFHELRLLPVSDLGV